MFCPHPWQRWSILGSSLIVFITWFSVQVGVAVNSWYEPFYDLIQKAMAHPNTIKIETFYHLVNDILSIVLIAVVINVINLFLSATMYFAGARP